MKKVIVGGIVGCSALAMAAQHAIALTVIIDPSKVASSISPQQGLAVNLLDSSSLSSSLGTEGTSIPYPSSFPTANELDGNTSTSGYNGDARWTLTSAPVTLTFTLDQKYTLSGIYYYNYTENYKGTYYNTRGAQVGNVLYSTDGGSAYTSVEQVTFVEAPSSTTYTGAGISFSDIPGVNSVELVLPATTDAGGKNDYGDNQYLGLNEVRFTGDTDTPEPGTFCLIAVTAGAAMLRRRTRPRRASAAPR